MQERKKGIIVLLSLGTLFLALSTSIFPQNNQREVFLPEVTGPILEPFGYKDLTRLKKSYQSYPDIKMRSNRPALPTLVATQETHKGEVTKPAKPQESVYNRGYPEGRDARIATQETHQKEATKPAKTQASVYNREYPERRDTRGGKAGTQSRVEKKYDVLNKAKPQASVYNRGYPEGRDARIATQETHQRESTKPAKPQASVYNREYPERRDTRGGKAGTQSRVEKKYDVLNKAKPQASVYNRGYPEGRDARIATQETHQREATKPAKPQASVYNREYPERRDTRGGKAGTQSRVEKKYDVLNKAKTQASVYNREYPERRDTRDGKVGAQSRVEKKYDVLNRAYPSYYRGIYLNNYTLNAPQKYKAIIHKAKQAHLNVLVIDVQPKLPSRALLQELKQEHFHIVGRIVVFPRGLGRYPAPQARLKRVYALIKSSAQLGFDEIQLDYIRFSDTIQLDKVSLKQKYQQIERILEATNRILQNYRIPWGADVFGRVCFNTDDSIGQKLEIFSQYAHTIYPMLYPSHFYGIPEYISNPYRTIKDGLTYTKRRIGKEARIVAFIQAFKMSIKESELSFAEYIQAQIKAAKDAGTNGYVAWNARNDYTVFFQAIESLPHEQSDVL